MIDWEVISAFADEKIIHALQTSESFTSAQAFRHQTDEACRILPIQHHHAVPYSMIDRLFGIAKATSTSQFQPDPPLDLSTFGVTKRLISRGNRMEAVNL
jgi:hypothetical protein